LRHWIKHVKLSEVIEQFIVPQRDKPKIFEGNTPWCRIEDFNGKYLFESKTGKTVSDELIKTMPLRVFPKKTVIVSCSADLGRCAIIGKPLVTNQTFIGLVPSNNIDSEFLYYLMTSRAEQLNGMATGATIKYLSKKKFQNLEVPVPPLSEQKRIIAILDEAFEAIDQAKANIERNIQNAEELFQSKLNEVFSQQGEGWEEKKLIEITTKIGSGATPRGGKNSYKESGLSLIRSLNVYDEGFQEDKLAFIDDKQAEKLSNVELYEGDVLLNITGASVARCCVVPKEYLPGRVNQHVSIIRLREETMKPEFLHYLLISKSYKDRLLGIGEQGATRQAITKAQLQDFNVSYPDNFADQDLIISVINHYKSLSDRLKHKYLMKSDCLDELKKSILQKAFTGELTANVELPV